MIFDALPIDEGGRFLKKRSNRVEFRLDDRELAHLNKIVSASGLKREQFLRDLIAGKDLRTRPKEEWAAVVRQISSVGNNINQIARHANTVGAISRQEFHNAVTLLSDVWRIVKNL
ncbi:plasmid mobilization relaxosome protein MobC [Butyricicoccus sp. 1XD8-22]|nr:plasmid mobilization relaxosome protein MobC [Butyricicoccus sp. 1XD8-22]